MEISLLKASDNRGTLIAHDRGDKSWAAVPAVWKAHATRSQAFVSCGSCWTAREVQLAGHCSCYTNQPFSDCAELSEELLENSF